jgi:hypothetical protein
LGHDKPATSGQTASARLTTLQMAGIDTQAGSRLYASKNAMLKTIAVATLHVVLAGGCGQALRLPHSEMLPTEFLNRRESRGERIRIHVAGEAGKPQAILQEKNFSHVRRT